MPEIKQKIKMLTVNLYFDSCSTNGWISVEDSLPPFDKEILGYIKHRADIGYSEIQACFLGSDSSRWQLSSLYDDPRYVLYLENIGAVITHWMPLPNAPKEN